MLESKVEHFISHNYLIQPADRVLVGVSGGADSVGLLVILSQLKALLGFELFAGHLNHQLRGHAADEDERFVIDLAQRLNIPLYTERQDIPTILAQRGGSLEETARTVRYEFYERAARHFSAGKIALAHHQGDQCETILFNMLRGSSIHGLRGIPVRRKLNKIEVIRPLLEITKTDIEQYLQSKSIAWRTDATNLEPCTTRNTLRLKVLPTLEEISPSFRDHLLLLGRQAGQIETLLHQQADAVLTASRRVGDDIQIERWRLKTLPEILACEVVRKMLLATGAKLRYITARHLRDLAGLETKMELPDGWRARVEHSLLIIGPKRSIENKDHAIVLPIGEPCRFGPFEFSAQLRDFDPKVFKEFLRNKTPLCEWLDADKTASCLEIRYARDGDRFHPLGAPGHKKIGDFLTDIKAGWSARPALVVTDEQGIIWLVGRRIDDRVRIDADTRHVLILSACPVTGEIKNG